MEKVRIITVSDYVAQSRGIKIGDEFDVKGKGMSANKDRLEKRLFIIDAKNGKATAVYYNEVEVIEN
jgi:hypothetical protein